jgi:hypothetical protein
LRHVCEGDLNNKQEVCECRDERYLFNKTSKKCIYCPDIGKNFMRINNTCGCDTSKYGYSFCGKKECTNCSSLGIGMILENRKCICNSSEYVMNCSSKKCIKCSSISQ